MAERQRTKRPNPVAKFAPRVNRCRVHRDRKAELKRGARPFRWAAR